ncbi:AraC family transcriptional regulator [Paenibacillus sp. LHD-38]|uniref:AraC family transcriptional regulator n=1 Tax=Paenibacillus sp. LHD-38 TaxID=3072143 RepID=UPI00280E6279|nr:AraC family transcriptional regulator [Paenibacillus sp. LHD-38]MDQ8738008.1 AraC family transcriptional regulator [Paenibacillus sp. LHD-38]
MTNQSIRDQLQASLHYMEESTYDSRNLHIHQSYCTVSYIKRGNVTVYVEDRTHHATSGDVMIHRPGVEIRVINEHEGVHLFMNIDLKVLGDVDFFQLYPLKNIIRLRDPARYEEYFYELYQHWQQDHSFREAHCTFLMLMLLSEVLSSARTNLDIAPLDLLKGKDRFRHVIQYMHEHLHEKITRETLAELVHMHPVYFSRDFHKIYGNTPVAMLKKLRLRRAKTLLEHPNLTISLIAEQCGFYDQAHFTRTFYETYQLLPSEYRESLESSIDYTKRGLDLTLSGYGGTISIKDGFESEFNRMGG